MNSPHCRSRRVRGTFAPACSPARSLSERIEERDQLVLLCRAQVSIVVDHECGFTRMSQNRFIACERLAIMHQAVAGANAPQRSRAHLVRRVWRAVLHDSVAGADVMQKKVAVRMDHLTS